MFLLLAQNGSLGETTIFGFVWIIDLLKVLLET